MPLKFDADAQLAHEFRTRDFAALVAELEHWLLHCQDLSGDPN